MSIVSGESHQLTSRTLDFALRCVFEMGEESSMKSGTACSNKIHIVSVDGVVATTTDTNANVPPHRHRSSRDWSPCVTQCLCDNQYKSATTAKDSRKLHFWTAVEHVTSQRRPKTVLSA